jgi:capsular polysaccharide biosynthesis protein
MHNTPSSNQFNFLELIKFIIKWRKQLAIITISAAVVSYLITFALKPEYKSKAVFYPGTVNSISYALFYSLKERAQDALAYGDEENVEQYMQLAKSSQLREKISADFNLMEHYGIDANDPKRYAKLNKKFDKYVSVNRTPFNSVEVIVFDTDPELSARIANAVMYNTDSLKKQSQRIVAQQAYNIVKQEYENKVAIIDSLSQMTRTLGNEGVYNVEEQSRGLAELIGKGTNNSFTDKERENLGQHVGDFVSLDEQIRFEAEQLTDLRKKYNQCKLDLDSKLSNIFVVDVAQPNYDKAYPMRLIIAMLSAIAAFIFSIISIVVLERIQNIKQQLSQQ